LNKIVLTPNDQAANIAKQAGAANKTIREFCLENKLLPEKELNKALDLKKLLGPNL